MLKAGVRQRVSVSRHNGGRRVPLAYSEAVEKWARERGGHAKLKWMPAPMNCWAVILEFKVGDPRRGGPSDGEPVLLHDWKDERWWKRYHPERAKRNAAGRVLPGAYAYDLDELGVEGVIARLDKGNILSGRGEFDSLQGIREESQKRHEVLNERRRLSARDNAGARARDIRRSRFKIPFLPVGIQLSKES